MVGSENPESAVWDRQFGSMTDLGGERSRITLSDEAVVLRPWISSDAAFIFEASSDPAIERYNGLSPASPADAVAVIEHIQESWRAFDVEGDPTGTAFAIVDAASGEPIGMCGVDDWSDTDVAQFGYWLAAGARGRGFATRAVELMTGWLFGLGAARVFLTIESGNAASVAVARRARFHEHVHSPVDGDLQRWRIRRRTSDRRPAPQQRAFTHVHVASFADRNISASNVNTC